jgi:hypothetical protein
MHLNICYGRKLFFNHATIVPGVIKVIEITGDNNARSKNKENQGKEIGEGAVVGFCFQHVQGFSTRGTRRLT